LEKKKILEKYKYKYNKSKNIVYSLNIIYSKLKVNISFIDEFAKLDKYFFFETIKLKG